MTAWKNNLSVVGKTTKAKNMYEKHKQNFGKLFGELTILDYIPSTISTGNRVPKYKTLCSCGNEYLCPASSVLKGQIKSCGHKKFEHGEHMVGTKHGKLTIIEFIPYKMSNSKGSKYKCVCDCGKQTVVESAQLVSGRIYSCGHARPGQRRKAENLFWKHRIKTYKKGANKRNKCWELSDEFAIELMSRNCSSCGAEPRASYAIANRHQKYANKSEYDVFDSEMYDARVFPANGIDRINNNEGYTIENCRPMCSTCNYSKGKLTETEWQEWADRFVKFRGAKND